MTIQISFIAGVFNLLSSRANLDLRAAVIADYKIIMDILNIIMGGSPGDVGEAMEGL